LCGQRADNIILIALDRGADAEIGLTPVASQSVSQRLGRLNAPRLPGEATYVEAFDDGHWQRQIDAA
jgi:hypothetical protein